MAQLELISDWSNATDTGLYQELSPRPEQRGLGMGQRRQPRLQQTQLQLRDLLLPARP